MKAKFHGPCEITVVCSCGAKLEIEEIQHKGSYRTLYTKECESCTKKAIEDYRYWRDFNESL